MTPPKMKAGCVSDVLSGFRSMPMFATTFRSFATSTCEARETCQISFLLASSSARSLYSFLADPVLADKFELRLPLSLRPRVVGDKRMGGKGLASHRQYRHESNR